MSKRKLTEDELAGCAKFKAALEASGLGDVRVGELVDVTPGMVWQWAHARRPISAARAEALAAAVGNRVTPEEISPAYRAAVSLRQGSSIREPAAEYAIGNGLTRQIPHLNVNGSMGSGQYPPEHVKTVRSITVSVPELRKQTVFTSPNQLAFITGYGDSMTPTYSDGDVLLVDQGVSDHKVDGVYVFTYDGEMFIKTLQRVPGKGVMAVSHNRAVYEPFALDPSKPLHIHGRVVLAWNARKL